MRAVIAIFLLGGCSLALSRGPDEPRRPGDCSTSRAAPTVDRVTAIALTSLGAFVIGGTVVATAISKNNHDELAAIGVLAGAIVAATSAPWWASSVYGYHRSDACTAAYRDELPEDRALRDDDPKVRESADAARIAAALAARAEKRRAIARGLVETAALAVEHGDCETAALLGAQIIALDPAATAPACP